MTRVFLPGSSEEAELCQPVLDSSWERMHEALGKGVRLARSWRSPRMHLIRRDGRRRYVEVDAPWFASHGLVLRPRAVDALEDLLQSEGELLRLRCDEAELFLWHVTRCLPALDDDRSRGVRFEDGRWMRVEKYVWKPRIVSDHAAFRIRGDESHAIFVTDEFVRAWTKAGLMGLVFRRT